MKVGGKSGLYFSGNSETRTDHWHSRQRTLHEQTMTDQWESLQVKEQCIDNRNCVFSIVVEQSNTLMENELQNVEQAGYG